MRLVLVKKSVTFLMMSSGGKITMMALVGLVLAPTLNTRVTAAIDDGPYRAIIERNIFDTQPMPPPPKVVPPPIPLPNVKLVGVMAITGRPQAIIWYQDPGTPPKQPVTKVMVAGQRVGDITVLDIDVAAKTAKVQVLENISTLALEDKPAPAAPVAPSTGTAGIQRPKQPTAATANGFAPATSAFAQPASGGFRNPAASATGGYNNSGPAGAAPADLSQVGGGIGQTLPTRQVRTDGTQDPQITPEQQMILIEAQRDAMLRAHDPTAVIMPQTPLGDLMNKAPNPAAH